jgi:hypothetical protein
MCLCVYVFRVGGAMIEIDQSTDQWRAGVEGAILLLPSEFANEFHEAYDNV